MSQTTSILGTGPNIDQQCGNSTPINYYQNSLAKQPLPINFLNLTDSELHQSVKIYLEKYKANSLHEQVYIAHNFIHDSKKILNYHGSCKNG